MFFVLFLLWQSAAAPCADAADCRARAEEAATRGDYEAFHDLAWRVAQKGKPNDPAVMLLLARAQALSGRPGDALVMLGRLFDLGVKTDAATNADFAHVRLLPGWPELEARLTGKPVPAPVAPAPVAPAPSAPVAPAAPAPVAPSAPLAPVAPTDALSFDAPGLDPHGLAHDAISRRFVLGDRRARRLLVIDEVSRHVVTYVSAGSAGFQENVTAFTIDSRRGDLWVVSVDGEAEASSSVLHKLQLVSGRVLEEVRLAGPPARLVDVTVAPDGAVYALDALGPRVFRLRPGARTLEPVMRLDMRGPTALTAAGDGLLYVAAERGIARVDVVSRSAAPVTSIEALTGFESLSWRAGSLIGVERVAGSSLIVRIPLDRSGRHAEPRRVLAASPEATVGALGRDAYYYLAGQTIIRRIPLK